jgi:hypothetical protein
MKRWNWLSSTRYAVAIGAGLFFADVGRAYTPVQTAQTWVSALKRNDVNTLLLLALTPERYLQERESVNWFCHTPDKGNWGGMFALDQANPKQALFEMLAPELKTINAQRDSIAGEMQTAVDELLNNNKDPLDADQAAAIREVALATKSWALRTDFSDEKRLRRAIDVFVSEVQPMHKMFGECEKHDSVALIKNLDRGLRAIKGVLKAYDFDVDQALSQTSFSSGGNISQSDGRSIAKVRINYRLFEARGTSILELYQAGDQWFFWQESFF